MKAQTLIETNGLEVPGQRKYVMFKAENDEGNTACLRLFSPRLGQRCCWHALLDRGLVE